MKQRRIKPLPEAELRTLTTKPLLAYRSALLALEDLSWGTPWGKQPRDPSLIYFKDDPRWPALYALVKAELSTREHIK